MSSPSDSVPPLAIGALLRFALDDLRTAIYEGVVASGFDDVRPAHVTLFRWPGPDGQRPTHLAAHCGISKQALNELLRELEDRGYLTLHADDTDERARVIRLTARGRQLHRAALAAHAKIEEDWASILGAERYAQVRRALAKVVDARGAIRSGTARRYAARKRFDFS